MKKIKIITDSESGFTQEESDKLGIFNIPMPFLMDGEDYLEGINITIPEFYEKLEADADVSTSQPSPGYLLELWDNLLKEYDELVYIPMMSGLSGTCETAKMLASDEKYQGKVFVVDNLRISLTQKESVLEAVALLNQGKSSEEIKDYLESTKDKASIYIMVSTLKYLKKGGRVTPTVAALGSMLKLKPVLTTRGGNFDKATIVFTENQGKKKMISFVKKDLETTFKDEYESGRMTISVAHTNNIEEAMKFKAEIEKDLPLAKFRFVDELSLSVACHIGAGSLAVAIAVDNFLDETLKML